VRSISVPPVASRVRGELYASEAKSPKPQARLSGGQGRSSQSKSLHTRFAGMNLGIARSTTSGTHKQLELAWRR
jgi:hypothetical protein